MHYTVSLNKYIMIAKQFFSGFEDAHETYNAITEASDGKIYYILCSGKHDVGAQMYVYNPSLDTTEFIADLSEVLGEKTQKYIFFRTIGQMFRFVQ